MRRITHSIGNFFVQVEAANEAVVAARHEFAGRPWVELQPGRVYIMYVERESFSAAGTSQSPQP